MGIAPFRLHSELHMSQIGDKESLVRDSLYRPGTKLRIVCDGAGLANGDLMNEGGVEEDRGGGGGVGSRRRASHLRGSREGSWAIGYRQLDCGAHESYGLF
jgi:hypothetical protein